jgi:GDP-4-dehydro-6-deoxy-D-mannose reductase
MNKTARILITGASGLAGSWLKKRLEKTGFSNLYFLDIASTDKDGRWFAGSVSDGEFISRLISDVKPEYVFHFAGLLGNQDRKKLDSVNVGGTENILSALVSNRLLRTRVLVTSSSAVYGDKGDSPVTEDMISEGKSNYGLSKIEQEKKSLEYFYEYGLPVIVSRAFNNIAPGERETMFVSRIATQIVKIEHGVQDSLEIGPIFSYRDYLDTRDLVEAYIATIGKGIPGEIYNVCSGETIRIEELFHILLSHAKKRIEYKIIDYDQSGNIPYQRGSSEKLRTCTGWAKRLNIRDTVVEVLEYWRERYYAQ